MLTVRPTQALGDGQRMPAVGVRQVDDELLAAVARDHVTGPQGARAYLGQRLDHQVAGRVAEAVVDLLEVVDIDHQHGELVAAAPGPRLFLAREFEERAAVEHAGQRVDQRQAPQIVLVPGQPVEAADRQHDHADAERPAGQRGRLGRAGHDGGDRHQGDGECADRAQHGPAPHPIERQQRRRVELGCRQAVRRRQVDQEHEQAQGPGDGQAQGIGPTCGLGEHGRISYLPERSTPAGRCARN